MRSRPKPTKNRILCNLKATKPTLRIAFLLLLSLLPSPIKPKVKRRIREARLLIYAQGSTPPLSPYFQTPSSIAETRTIIGTIEARWTSAPDRIELEILYRNLTNSSPLDSLVLKLQIPFQLEDPFQDKQLFYSSNHHNQSLKLNESSLRLFSVDQDFGIFDGEEIKADLKLSSINSKIHVEIRKQSNAMIYKPYIKNLEVFFSLNGGLQSIVFDESLLDNGPVHQTLYTAIVVALFIIIVLTQNELSYYVVYKQQKEIQIKAYLLATNISSIFSMPFLMSLLKNYSSWEMILALSVVYFLAAFQNLGTGYYFYVLYNDHEDWEHFKENAAYILIVVVLNLGWLVFLILESSWIFKCQLFFGLMLLMDMLLFLFKKKAKYADESTATNVSLGISIMAVKGFLVQVSIVLVYVANFYLVQMTLPSSVWLIGLIECGIFAVYAIVCGVFYTASRWVLRRKAVKRVATQSSIISKKI